ncbi:hypothetical protein PAE4_10619 [Bacillus altitudinis]|nr:hypothetical protein PAE4_10619 [Bacillus altitudinis]
MVAENLLLSHVAWEIVKGGTIREKVYYFRFSFGDWSERFIYSIYS